MRRVFSTGLAGVPLITGIVVFAAQDTDPLKPRVPEHQRASAKKLTSPIKATSQVVEEGRALYEGKGTCLNCHGKSGRGNGPAGAALNPAPPDFTNCSFQKNRSDGELFWVIKNGSPGTAMFSLVPAAVDEAEAWKIIAYIRTFCKEK